MANEQRKTENKPTLRLTELTLSAMTLVAPGAFLWTTFQVQAAQTNGGVTTAGAMWGSVVIALIIAFLTAISYAELSSVYPQSASGSSYYFAEAALLEKEKAVHRRWARVAKFLVGWTSHLYYWIYPGIIVAFSGTVIVYILGLYHLHVPVAGSMVVAVAFAASYGYISYRGVRGSTFLALFVNVIQLLVLALFSMLVIAFRLSHPEVHYAASASSIAWPHGITNLLFQSTIAIVLLVGFESLTTLGADAIDPKRDIRRAMLLSLVIQGLFAYLMGYFAANYFVGDQMTAVDSAGRTLTGYAAAAASSGPIGEMTRVIGDVMLGGTGNVLALILAATVVLSLITTALGAFNTGVRITYAISRDPEIPSVLGLLRGRFATPVWGIALLAVVSGVFGAYGVASVHNLTRLVLASNTGTFVVYALTNLVALLAFTGRSGARLWEHKVIPLVGALLNLIMLGTIVYMGVTAGGESSRDAVLALGLVVLWLIVGTAWFAVNTWRKGRPALVQGGR